MIEQFAGVCDMVLSELRDLNHTGNDMVLVSLMISTFAPKPASSTGELRNRDTGDRGNGESAAPSTPDLATQTALLWGDGTLDRGVSDVIQAERVMLEACLRHDASARTQGFAVTFARVPLVPDNRFVKFRDDGRTDPRPIAKKRDNSSIGAASRW